MPQQLHWAAMLPAAPAPAPITRVAVPAPPVPPARQPFPVIATIAPVLMSVVLWMVTQSVFSLVFAALGPVIAVASLVDSRRGGRRRARLDQAAFECELQQARDEIAAAHELERAARAAAAPSAGELLEGPQPVHWGSEQPPLLMLGLADQHSSLTLDGPVPARGDDVVSTSLRALRQQATQLRAAPLVIAAGRGVGIAGPTVAAAAVARALMVQLLAAFSPAQYGVAGTGDWLAALPHARTDGSFEVGGVRIAMAAEPAALSGVDTVVQLCGASARVVRGEQRGLVFTPEHLGVEQALVWAQRASEAARRVGLGRAQLPQQLHFSDLPAVEGVLASAIGQSADGPITLDLAVDGPHAVVGGTTGSGKSELLTTWLLGMAAHRSPAELAVLLVDFKGGTSFGALPRLPHCVGLVTDLEPAGATRALRSLAAELRHRERLIAAASARSIDEVAGMARLVIAVDEFAAMAAELPELHALFADIAARGRSLGVHLVLCTQRPAGVVRDGVLANASLRVSLRVNNRADSTAVIGTDAAALGSAAPGRAWVARGGGEPQQLQVAMATAHDIDRVAQRWRSANPPRRPWLDPLPSELAPELAAGAIALVDLPEQQAQRGLDWHPGAGSLLVVGASGSGKTAALRAVAAVHGAAIVGADLEAAWDCLDDPPAVLALDDVDAVLARLPPDYQQAFIDRLAGALRDPRCTLVLSAQRLGAALQQLSGLIDHRILLRMPTRQEHVIAGGRSDSFDPALPPGAGWWRGDRMQLVLASQPAVALAATSLPLSSTRPGLAVSPRPQALAARLAAAGLGDVVVTDPESWLADWGRYSALARQQPVLFAECSPIEFRQLSRRRALPPPIADPRTTGWVLEPEGEPLRLRF
jgi:DNA segregation ATPase FtsK/SpoIIIE, S-DNA-T family